MIDTRQLEYDVSASASYYGPTSENNIMSIASHIPLLRQPAQKRKRIYEELEVDAKRSKSAALCPLARNRQVPGRPAVQAAYDLLDLSNVCEEE